MNEEIIKIIGSKVIDAGLWKFYIALIVFIISFLINYYSKEITISEKIMILASLLLGFVTLMFIILGHLSQYI